MMNQEQEKNKGAQETHLNHKVGLTIGQRAADTVTRALGSWVFIIFYLVYIFSWIGINLYGFYAQWDPYPFILLNLTLSCLAALQAPIILMSQNRVVERDRITAKYDYALNRKAEREIQLVQKELETIKKMIGELKPSSITKKTL